jgi:hypothetical protein
VVSISRGAGYDVSSRSGWKVRYLKEVDANEVTLRFYQEVYNEIGEMIEVHHKYPVVTLPRFYRHLAKEENDEIGGSHGNRHTTAVYRRL